MMSQMDIVKIIYEAAKETSPVKLQFGKVVNHVVVHDNVIIKECPAFVMKRLADAGCSFSVDEDGVEVFKM